ncbi:MAG: CsbD family protein [Phycisphaerae bacterium]
MNSDRLKGQWLQLKGQAKQKWGKLTNDDLDRIDGENERLIGKIQERYGIARQEAEKQVEEWSE